MKYSPRITAFLVSIALAPGAVCAQQAAPLTALQNNQIRLFRAVDEGDVQFLQAHFNFVRSFQNVNPDVFANTPVDLNFRDQLGNTPLIHASMHPNEVVVQMLIDGGADINAVNMRNESALVTSYTYQNYTISQYLLARGAADPYKISQLLPQVAVQKQQFVRSEESSKDLKANMQVVGGAAIAGGIGVAAALAGGGGGGGGSAAPSPDAELNPQNLAPNSFVTAEALGQQGIVGMNTQFALARGYDGQIYDRNPDGTLVSTTPIGFVKVAVVDSGVDLTHPDLAANLLPGDSVTCDDNGCVAGGGPPPAGSENWHGTAVAGVIGAVRNGVGIYGVASQAKIMAIGFADAAGDLTNGDAPGIKVALDNGAQVINGSYGFPNFGPPAAGIGPVGAIINGSFGGTTLATQYQRGVAAHSIFVYSAGNEGIANADIPAGLPFYFQGATAPTGITQGNYDTLNPGHLDWSKNWVSVVSVDNSNVISTFSNRCGVTMNWCIAAPGEISNSTDIGGGYTGPIQGTSFSAPNVTGAIAVMLGAFPQLTPEKVVEILFSTATDLGAAGVDSVYGHGLVNLEKATSPTSGGWSLLGRRGHAFTYQSSGMALSAPFGNAIGGSRAYLQFVDGYGKNYTIPLSAVAGNLAQSRTAIDRLGNFADADRDNVMKLGDGSVVRFSAAQNNADAQLSGMSKFSYATKVGDGENRADVAVHYKTNLADTIAKPDEKSMASDALKNPYLNIADRMNSGVVDVHDGDTTLTMAAYQGNYSQYAYQYVFNTPKSLGGAYSQLTYQPKDTGLRVTVDGGMNVEKNSMLGSETSGSFGIDHSNTYFTGISGKYMLAKDMALIANYHMGMTQVATDRQSVIEGVGTLFTNSFAVGAELYNVGQKNDTLGFVMSQPLRVTSGAAALNLPVNVLSSGDVVYQRNRLNLAPGGRELDFETYYRLKSGEDADLGVDAMYRVDANNSTGNNDATFLAKYTLKGNPEDFKLPF